MSVQQAYDAWSQQYDTNENKTRDLEAKALRETLANIPFARCLEIGCGTGKNTAWLLTKAAHITAVDLSAAMLAKAQQKINSSHVEFIQADILQPWDFAVVPYNLVSFSLVLEHIEKLQPVFEKLARVLAPGGYIYAGELHPFKQYTGSKARYSKEDGSEEIVSCFNHHVSDFTDAARQSGFSIVTINEYFDEDDRQTVPRILTLLFRSEK